MMRDDEDCGLAVVLACPSCTRSFKRGYKYCFHVKNCAESKCGNVFTNNIQLKKHYVKHKESIRCDVCLRFFSGQQALKRHKTSLHDNVKFDCSVCKKHFSTQGNMLRHKKMHTS
ncbi:MDS1 and EVI1 complex locus protein EVI1-B-like [Hydra vulgaris]|uniref:MDS1 and EVI1 complex locus protein EVI1-B-like n=1 Tax=Hydra vulgaris TaxID=6087 RepID=A0ABM4CU08_HYDVU